jgi:glycosyltransferase involved in cell wall biosynthesis
MAAIRVLRVITRLNIGGPSIQAITLADRLQGRGFDTTLVHGSLGAGEGDMRYLMPPTVCAHQIEALRRDVAPAHDVRALQQLIAIVRSVRPHIVHTHMAKAGTLGRLAALIHNRIRGRRDRARVVHTYHGHVLEGYFGAAKTRLFLDIERRLARITDRLVAISPEISHELVDEQRIGDPSQYRVVRLGFDLSAFAAIGPRERQQARATLTLPPGAPVITTVGRLTSIKQHRLFLDVAARVLQHHPDSVFLIAGDGELRPELEEHARALNIASRTRFLGWRRDLTTIYAATNVFLLTSRNEGTPVALIEALAAGCDTVATDVGGVRDVLGSHGSDRTAAFDDVTRLADLVVRALAARTVDSREHARTEVIERFSVDRLIDDVERLYHELID